MLAAQKIAKGGGGLREVIRLRPILYMSTEENLDPVPLRRTKSTYMLKYSCNRHPDARPRFAQHQGLSQPYLDAQLNALPVCHSRVLGNSICIQSNVSP